MRLGAAIAFGIAFLWLNGSALGQEFVFTKIADTNTLIPGGANNFQNLGQPVIDNNGNIAFTGCDDIDVQCGFGRRGIYLFNEIDGLSVVVDNLTPTPGGSSFFSFKRDNLSIDNGDVAFRAVAIDPNTNQNVLGLYARIGGQLVIIVEHGVTPAPDGAGTIKRYFPDDLQIHSDPYLFCTAV